MKQLAACCLAALLYLLPAQHPAAAGDAAAGAPPAAAVALWQQMFPNATELGEKDAGLPVWPVYQVGSTIGYLFESVDFVAIPGYSGEPINLLVGIDSAGTFVDVRLLAHNEPIFLHGLGEAPLLGFLQQYQGLSAIDNIKVGTGSSTAITYLDGITKATASVVVINESILLSALKVARQKLEGFEPAPVAEVRGGDFTPLDWQALLDKGYVRRLTLRRSDIEAAFAGTWAAAMDEDLPQGDAQPFIDLYYAYLNVPSIGRNLLGERDYQRLMDELSPGEQALAVMSSGSYSFAGEDFVPASVPDRLTVQQGSLPIEIRDINFYDYHPVNSAYLQQFDSYKLLRIKPQSEFDPASAWRLSLLVSRSRGLFFDTVTANFDSDYQLPAFFFRYPETRGNDYTPAWVLLWESRRVDIAVLVLSLVVLTAIIVWQHRLTRRRPLLRWLRGGFLLFTLVFIGWYAQGQLSVVNVLTLLQALLHGFNIRDFLIDPIVFILWLYVFASLLLWGRGVFCGWLCPFGVLQEMVAGIAQRLRIRQWKIPYHWHTRLWRVKYVLLLILVGTSFYSLTLAEVLSEVEPFKTAITLVFVRSWPFVLYAAILLALGLFVHKFFCRYLCPLGAGLAIVGRLRRFEWLNRRRECGSPCQLCRHKCEIGAISPAGHIDYSECIQCFECIVYYHGETLCPPQINAAKKAAAAAVAQPGIIAASSQR